MGNPRNLRRASSDEDGDVFDDKSEISSGSDEEGASRGEEVASSATDSSKGPLPPLPSESTAGASREEGAYQVSSKETGGGISAEAASADNERHGDSEEEAPETRRRFPRGGGGRRAIKSTWQLMQEDPSFVPRETRYFLHDDRRDGDGEESENELEAESKPDTSVPHATQTRVGPSKKLWTPDENSDVWKHDMWERLQKEETEPRSTARFGNRGRPARRRGYSSYGRGNRGERWLARGFRGGRTGGQEGYEDESWHEGRRYRGRGRGAAAWESDRRKKYVPRPTPAQLEKVPDTE